MTPAAGAPAGGLAADTAGPALGARTGRTRQLIARLAAATLLLTFVVIVASAFMRHTQAGLGCADWPACYARVSADPSATAPSVGVHVARMLHRLAASSALLLIVAMLWVMRGVPGLRAERALATASLVIALLLAALGILTPGAAIPAVPLGNLAGGFLMLAVLAALAERVASDPRDPGTSPAVRALMLALLAAVFVQTLLGGLIGTQFALPSCPALDRCIAAGDMFAGAALDPFRQPAIVAGHVVPPAGAAGVHLLHRALGAAIAVTTLLLAFGLRRREPHAARLLTTVLALAAPALGAMAVVLMPALTVTVLHNAVAAALVATLAGLCAFRRRR